VTGGPKTLAPDMLAQYRATTTPEFREQVDAFKAMSLAERDELLFYVSAYMANQYAALLNMLHGVHPGAPPGRAN
jgi:hypothetical protein